MNCRPKKQPGRPKKQPEESYKLSSSAVEELVHQSACLIFAHHPSLGSTTNRPNSCHNLGSRRGHLSTSLKDCKRLLTHQVPEVCGPHQIFHWDVIEACIRGVSFAVGRQALGDAHARAVELSDDPLVNRAWGTRLTRI